MGYDVSTKTNWGCHGCISREAPIAKGADEESVTAEERWDNYVGRHLLGVLCWSRSVETAYK